MKKTIIIGGAPVSLSASAGALIHYKKQFGTEYTDDYTELRELKEDIEVQAEKFAQIALRLLWAMARAADSKVAPFEDFVLSYEIKDLLGAVTEAQNIFISAIKKTESSGSGESFTSERLLAQALICGLSVDDLDDMPLTMVLDTIGEWCKAKGYAEEDAREATQEDFDSF